ncbi:MAG: hypothetical protein AB1750_00455 [Chloroflexota bacterium]
MSLDLTLFSLYRVNGQDRPDMPGLAAVMPPRKTARGREHEPLILSLLIAGNTPFSDAEYLQVTGAAVAAFYNAPGALTTALRVAAESVNQSLLDRNLATTGRGQYVVGSLIVAALRENQLILLQSGLTHALALRAADLTRLHDTARSGKGIGLHPAFSQYFSQLTLQPGDRLLFCHAQSVPPAWENALVSERGLQPPETARRRLMALASGDVNATLIQAMGGKGSVDIARLATTEPHPSEPARAAHPTPLAPGEAAPRVSAPEAGGGIPSRPALDEAPRADVLSRLPQRPDALPSHSPAPDVGQIADLSNAAHIVGRPPENGPSAYAIPPQPPVDEDEALVEELAEMALQQERDFPSSIPRLPPVEEEPGPTVEEEAAPSPRAKRAPSETTRQAARVAVGGIQAWRRMSERLGAGLRKFLPRLLPDGESDAPAPAPASMSGAAQFFIAVAVPVMVAVIGLVVYLRLGRPVSYEAHLAQAEQMSAQARIQTDPVLQREAWSNVLTFVSQAEGANGESTPETRALRQEAQANLDVLTGVARLNFQLAVALDAQVSRMAASESDLYMLDAAQGRILRAAITGRGYELDLSFNCAPGDNGGATVGPMVDLLIPPKLNLHGATVIGVDAAGHLLYCAPGQVAHPETLTRPNARWERVTAMALDGLKLYVLDASSLAAWVYNSKEASITFPDEPYFYFGSQIPDIRDAIDMAVSGEAMYLLHADGRLTRCTFRRGDTVPTRCDSPVTLSAPSFPAYGAASPFAQAHFTQMSFAAPPETALLLLDADGRQVFRVNLQSFELQGIFGMGAVNLAPGPFSAMAVSPDHVLYLALGGQVYFSTTP